MEPLNSTFIFPQPPSWHWSTSTFQKNALIGENHFLSEQPMACNRALDGQLFARRSEELVAANDLSKYMLYVIYSSPQWYQKFGNYGNPIFYLMWPEKPFQRKKSKIFQGQKREERSKSEVLFDEIQPERIYFALKSTWVAPAVDLWFWFFLYLNWIWECSAHHRGRAQPRVLSTLLQRTHAASYWASPPLIVT